MVQISMKDEQKPAIIAGFVLFVWALWRSFYLWQSRQLGGAVARVKKSQRAKKTTEPGRFRIKSHSGLDPPNFLVYTAEFSKLGHYWLDTFFLQLDLTCLAHAVWFDFGV